MKQPSPETRHRVALWNLYRHPACHARPSVRRGGPVPDCSGILQAAHWISKQRLKQERSKVAVTRHRFDGDRRLHLLDVTIDELIADGRNGIVLCFEHHHAFDGKRSYELHLTVPPHVGAFAREYGLEHLVGDRPAEATPHIERGLLGGLLLEDAE